MDTGVSIALIVGCASLTGPLLLNLLNSRMMAKATAAADRQRLKEKLEDYRRQDEVAARVDAAATKAAEVAAQLIERDERQSEEAEAARLAAEEVARVAAINAAATNTHLVEIHALVNSSMTAAMMGELGAVTRELALMRDVVALHKTAGNEPSSDAQAAIIATEAKLAELQAAVTDREKQTAAAEEAAAKTKDKA